jgi:hypothetical protein
MPRPPIKYNASELNFISRHRTWTRKCLTRTFNCIFNRNISAANIKGLCDRNNWETGRTGRFKRGISSWSRGKKLDTGPNVTSFKRGHKPANHKPVGSERITKDGYIEIKIAEGNYKFKLKHRVTWEQHNGPIPKGHAIRFKDNNKQNCDINNLYLISQYENLMLNKYKYNELDEALKPIVKNIVTLQKKLLELKK